MMDELKFYTVQAEIIQLMERTQYDGWSREKLMDGLQMIAEENGVSLFELSIVLELMSNAISEGMNTD